MNHLQKIPFHSQQDHFLQFRQSLHTSVIVSPAVTLEMVHFKFSRRFYLLQLNTQHNIHRRRWMNNHQFRLQPDRLLRFNIFCGNFESLNQKNQSTTDISQTTTVFNRFFVLSFARVENSDRQQFAVTIFSLTFSLYRN